MKNKIMIFAAAFGIVSAFTSCNDSLQNSESTPNGTADMTTAAQTEEITEPEGTEPEETEPVEPDYPELIADENSITFDDGDLYTAHCMAVNDFEDDEADCILSVAEYKGEKQLRIEVVGFNETKGMYKVPKIVFDVDELVGSENLSKIKSFSADITQVAAGEFIGDDGEAMMVPGNFMGTFGSNVGEECADWYEPTGSSNGYAKAEWTFEWEYLHVEGKWLLKGYVDGTTDSTLVFMRWAIPNKADVYIDNITFYDADGNSIPIVYTPGENAEGEAEEENEAELSEETETAGEEGAEE